MFFNPKHISLKWHILTSSLLFDREHISPQFVLQITNTCFRKFENGNVNVFKFQTFNFKKLIFSKNKKQIDPAFSLWPAEVTSHPTNATRRNNFSTKFQYNFKSYKIIFENNIIYFSRKGTLTLTPGMGVGGPFMTKNPKQSPKISKGITTNNIEAKNIKKSLKNMFVLYLFPL